MSTDFWTTCKHFRSWFQPWLDMKEKWVVAFRHNLMEIEVNTNNGVGTKNRDFKRNFLSKYKYTSLSGVIKVLVEQFCPGSLLEGIIFIIICSLVCTGLIILFLPGHICRANQKELFIIYLID